MKILFFSSHEYDRKSFISVNQNFNFTLDFVEFRLEPKTAALAQGYDAVCAFVNDDLCKDTLKVLNKIKVKRILLRCAGFNNVDLDYAQKEKLLIYRVPEYSPYAVAEHAVGLLMCLNRKIHKSYNRVREGNFSLNALEGMDLFNKTVGIIGGGKIGECFANIMKGFGCKILLFDPKPSESILKVGVKISSLDHVFKKSDIVSLHCPLNEYTKYIINKTSIDKMKKGVILINTSRGGLIKTSDVIHGLKGLKIGALGIDVYEEEESIFFKDHKGDIIQDDVFERLMIFPNVLITGHQAFLTHEALNNISEVTLKNAITEKSINLIY